MTERDGLMRQLLAAFAGETQERLQEITLTLLELEKTPEAGRRGELLETVYRDAHSLKGAARVVNRGDAETVCQALEEVFARWKNGRLEPDPGTFDTLHQVVEGLAGLAAAPEGSLPDRAARLEELLRPLAGAGRQEGKAPERVGRPGAGGEPDPRAADGRTGGSPAAAAAKARQETVRISLAKLEGLLRQAEEMLAVKLAAAQQAADLRALSDSFAQWRRRWSRVLPELEGRSTAWREFLAWQQEHLHAMESQLGALLKATAENAGGIGRKVDRLLESSKKVLLFPFSSILQAFPKMVRDLAREQGKEIELVIRGAEIEIDRRILEEIKDPLIHLLRNCVDHGVERPEERERAGKPRRGTITIAVSQAESDQVRIEVCDDGAGIDPRRVREAAVRRGVVSAEEAARLGDPGALELIFRSGVSTRAGVTSLSGRGLGLSIVREKAERLGGLVRVETAPGRGSAFQLLLPLTLATFRGVRVKAAGREFIVPTANVERVDRVTREAVKTVENREAIPYSGGPLSFVRLADALELGRGDGREPEPIPFLVLAAGGVRIAFAVEEILAEQEVLQKSLGRQLVRVRNIGGATVLGDGQVVPILNVHDLLRSAVKAAAPVFRAAAEGKRERRSILLAEDSITARILLKGILESAGYSVRTAVDGIDALTALKTGEYHLLVSDVEMPRMDGFELTARIRGEQRLRELPVVLVTARESREDRERGVEVGANAYIVKSSFDQGNLLETIRRLL